MDQEYIKDKAKRKTGPFSNVLEVYTTGNKRVGAIHIPFAKTRKRRQKVAAQGILNEKANINYVWHYAYPFAPGKDCMYVRNPVYLYSFESERSTLTLCPASPC